MMFAGATCAQCHGNDARGRTINAMVATFETPDIRWSTLSQPLKEEDGGVEPAYDSASFARTVTKGIDSAGGALKAPMPAWDLTPRQFDALVAFLKTK
jgi:mono/diheme cytochrome c family protein